MNALRRHLSTLLLAAFIVSVILALLWKSEDARQVARDAVGLVFTFFTTPFILETSVALIGIMVVLVINQRRLDKEPDEWVEMEVPTKPKAAGNEHSPAE